MRKTLETLAALAESARTKTPRYYVPGGRLITTAMGTTVDHLPFGDGVTVRTSMSPHGDKWTAYVTVSTPAGEFSRLSERYKQPHRAARDAFAGVVADMRAAVGAAEATAEAEALRARALDLDISHPHFAAWTSADENAALTAHENGTAYDLGMAVLSFRSLLDDDREGRYVAVRCLDGRIESMADAHENGRRLDIADPVAAYAAGAGTVGAVVVAEVDAASGPETTDGDAAGAEVPGDAAEAVSDAQDAARARFAERARALGMPEWLTPDYGITGSRLLSWPATRGGKRVRIVGRLFNAHSEMVAVRDLRGEHSDFRATARRTVGDIMRKMRPATVAEAAAYVASGDPLTSYQQADVPADVMAEARDLAHAEALAEDAERMAAGRYSAGRGVRARDLLPGTVLHGGLIVRDVTFGHTTSSGRRVPGYILAWKLGESGDYVDARRPVMSADDVIMCDAENLSIQRQDPAEAFPVRCRVEYVSGDGDRITGCVLGVWTDYAPGAPVPAGVASHYAEVVTDAGAVRRVNTPHLRRIDGEGGPLVDLPEWIRPGAMVARDTRAREAVSVFQVVSVSRDGIAYVSPHDVRDGSTQHVEGDRWHTLAYYVKGWRPATDAEVADRYAAMLASMAEACEVPNPAGAARLRAALAEVSPSAPSGPETADGGPAVVGMSADVAEALTDTQDVRADRSEAARYVAMVTDAAPAEDTPAAAMVRQRIAYAVAVVTSRVGAGRLDAAFRAAAVALAGTDAAGKVIAAEHDRVFRYVLAVLAALDTPPAGSEPVTDAEILAENFDRYAAAGDDAQAAGVLALLDTVTPAA